MYSGPMRNTVLVLSSDGVTRYETDTYRQTCTCVAGQYGRRCRHLAAAEHQTEADRDAELMRRAQQADRRNSWTRNSHPGTD